MIKPLIENQETLTGYIFRLRDRNPYPNIRDIVKHCTWADLRRNIFNAQCIAEIARKTGQSTESLVASSFNELIVQIGEANFSKITYRQNIQYCPLCMNEKRIYKKEWCLKPIEFCSKHNIKLLSSCTECGLQAFTIVEYFDERCRACGRRLTRMGIYKAPNSTVAQTNAELSQILNREKLFTISEQQYEINDFLWLVQRSLFLMRGITETSFSEKQLNPYSSAIWMYQDFPYNFIGMMELFCCSRSTKQQYSEKAEFELLFQNDKFLYIQREYESFWSKRLNRRTMSSTKLLEEEAAYISKLEAAKILGIDYRYINQLLQRGILKEKNDQNEVSRYEVRNLLALCTGSLIEKKSEGITIKDMYIRYSAIGLNLVSIIYYIHSGILHPAKYKSDAKLLDAIFSKDEVDICLELFGKWKRKSKNNEVSTMQEKIELGMATISAKGLILNGRAYSNSAMVKYQWFEQAEKFGEWQCPVGYFPENPEHVVLFDTQGLEVATSIENQQHPDASVLEAYYDAINSLKEKLMEVKPKNKT